MRPLLAALLVAGLLLSGCASKGNDDDGDGATATSSPSASATASGTSSATASASATGTKAPNHAPTANLTAMTVGLLVNFTLSAADADGDNLTYAFQPGDGGDNATGKGPFPVVLNHTYAAAGLYNASLSVSDGHASAVALLRVNVTVAAAGAKQPVTFQGHADLPDPYNSVVIYPDGCAIHGSGPTPEGTFGTTFEVGDAYTGWAWSITDGATTMWWDGDSNIVGTGPAGTVPAAVSYVNTCIRPPGQDMDYVLTLTPP